MRNIWKVFKTDIQTLSKCFFACVVVVAIALLPSLYAWLNIYSNWDPYGNTGGISIAVVSQDEGYIDEYGKYENKGEDVLDDLRNATSIHWVIVDSEEEAKGGVESGEYYAAVVIDKQFTRNMYRMLTDWTGKPAITYYENAKKNAVATKITDTAVETLKRSISENYLEVIIGSIMGQGNLLAADLTEDDPEGAVRGVLYQAQDLLRACIHMMDAFQATSGNGVSSANAAAVEAAINNINKNLPDGSELQQTAAEIQLQLNTALARVERALDRLEDAIDGAPDQETTKEELLKAADSMDAAADSLEKWADRLEAVGTEEAVAQAEAARETAKECRTLAKQLRALAENPGADDLLTDCDKLVASIHMMADQIPVTAEALQKELKVVTNQVTDVLKEISGLSVDAKALKAALENTADALGTTMSQLRPATEKLLTTLEGTIEGLQELTGDEYMDTLLTILGGDPVVYGRYFPEMVQTSVHTVYPIANYGSAMTPFYTVLAIWVGGVILSSIVKIHARTEGLIDPKPAELFFGRYLFFFILSQIQAAIIVTGDLLLLKIQCLHPGMMYLTGGLTALTFSLLIYSLAISFGDVGKAIVVVIMVMQIAGSSGTFPIELLPEIFQKFYRFFPFPYAIDAMRECICGMYGNYYWQQIGFLLLFAVAALLIGLLVRRPFIGLSHFVEEKLEETELL